MLSHCRILWLVLPVLAMPGCVPSVDRDSTPVKQARDVKIVLEEKITDEVVTEGPGQPEGDRPDPLVTEAERPARMQPEEEPEEPATPEPERRTVDGPAQFSGKVVVKGTPPQLPLLVEQGASVRDAATCSVEPVPNESVVVAEDGGLANVFIYMRRPPRDAIPEADKEETEVDQKGCIFIPHAQVVRVGQTVQLKNSDPVAHNVRINALTGVPFNQTIPGGDTEGLEYQFRAPENLPVQVACDFHGWMSAWILPLNHPWGTVTDAQGNFVIENLPDGEWEFVVWHENHGYIERSAKVTARHGEITERVFEATAARLAP